MEWTVCLLFVLRSNIDVICLVFSIETVGLQPEGRSWHSLSVASDSFLFLYGGVNTNNEILGTLPSVKDKDEYYCYIFRRCLDI